MSLRSGCSRYNSPSLQLLNENNLKMQSDPLLDVKEFKYVMDADTSASLSDNLNNSGMSITDGTFFKRVVEKCTPLQTVAVCMKCKPGNVEIKGHAKSSSNFLSHLKRKHGPEALDEYNNYSKKKRKSVSESTEVTTRYCITNPSQEIFENNILKFIIHSMIPLSTVDDPYFKNIFSSLDIASKGLKMVTASSSSSRLDMNFIDATQKIKDSLKTVNYVCTTADVLPGRRISFLCVTAHWIKDNLERESVALACRGFRNSNPEKVKDLIDEINNEYGLDPTKFRGTITDNIDNFREAFKNYGIVDDLSDSDDDSDKETGLILPNYVKSCTHTLNLCLSVDVVQTISNSHDLSTIHNAVISKCNFLWQTTKSSEILRDILGYNIASPDEGRWNSLYDALKNILDIKGRCREVFLVLENKNFFTDDEFRFIEEHLECVKPIADALDILQSEDHTYYGTVVSVLFALLPKLEILNAREWKFCQPISESLLNSVRYRFQEIFNFSTSESLNAAIAALSHPQFKNRWLPRVSITHQNKIMMLFKKAVAAESTLVVGDEVAGDKDLPMHEFFDFGEENCSSVPSSELLVLRFLNDSTRSLDMLDGYPEIKKVFMIYNTPLSSSASVVRLFSVDTIRNANKWKKSREDVFEVRLLMKANSHFLQAT